MHVAQHDMQTEAHTYGHGCNDRIQNSLDYVGCRRLSKLALGPDSDPKDDKIEYQRHPKEASHVLCKHSHEAELLHAHVDTLTYGQTCLHSRSYMSPRMSYMQNLIS